MIATTRIYLVGSSQSGYGSLTFGLARKIQECSRCADTACRYPAFTTNVTRIKVHRRPVPFSECLIRPLHYGCVGLRHPYAYRS